MGLSLTNSHAKKRDQFVAIDLGARSTKAVLMQRRGDGFILTNYVVLETPQTEKALSTEALTELFREVSRALGNRTKYVVLALGVNDTVFKQVEVPLMPLPDVRLMLKFNSKTYLQQDLPDHVFDCQFTAPKAGEAPKVGANQKMKAFVGAARKPLIEDCAAAFKAAGLIADQIVPAVIGPVNAFESAEPEAFRQDVVALVELGFKNTSITILSSGEILLNRVVSLGGDRLTSGLADSLGITYQEAENIKIGMPAEVVQNLEPLIHPLGRELRASIDFFENQHDKAVSKVYLSGASARSELMVQTLQAELMVPCELWNPAKRLEPTLTPDKSAEFEAAAPQLTVAIGSAAANF
jgi:type IV pilus assembly protein PilM